MYYEKSWCVVCEVVIPKNNVFTVFPLWGCKIDGGVYETWCNFLDSKLKD